VKILLCRCSAQKIATDSGKKLQKNNIKPKKIQPKITTRTTVIPKTKSKPQRHNRKDIEKDLIENDPLKGFETDIDIHKSNEAKSASFETIAPEKDNPVRKEFEIGQLESDELQEDEITRNEPGQSTTGNAKPSKRNFNILKILHQ